MQYFNSILLDSYFEQKNYVNEAIQELSGSSFVRQSTTYE